jgi:hypothetical protein
VNSVELDRAMGHLRHERHRRHRGDGDPGGGRRHAHEPKAFAVHVIGALHRGHEQHIGDGRHRAPPLAARQGEAVTVRPKPRLDGAGMIAAGLGGAERDDRIPRERGHESAQAGLAARHERAGRAVPEESARDGVVDRMPGGGPPLAELAPPRADVGAGEGRGRITEQ